MNTEKVLIKVNVSPIEHFLIQNKKHRNLIDFIHEMLKNLVNSLTFRMETLDVTDGDKEMPQDNMYSILIKQPEGISAVSLDIVNHLKSLKNSNLVYSEKTLGYIDPEY